MYVIEVIPISRSIGTSSLSYFTSKEIPLGAIVDIPLRKKIIHGIVISVKKAEDMKSEIKTASFALKKIDKIKSIKFFTPGFMEMIVEVANYYATNPGAILDILVPKYILNNISKLKIDKTTHKMEPLSHEQKYAIQGDFEERYSNWKSLIRQEFAKKKSVLFIVPTIEEAEYAYSLLEKGIEGYAFILHGSLAPKEIIESWNNIMKEEHSVVIIATGGFFSLPRNDIETLIIESESSKSYKVLRRPYIDIRTVAEIYAKKQKMKIIFADNILRLETLWREDEGIIIQSSPFKFRSLSTATDTLINMKEIKSFGMDFKIISDEVLQLIQKTKDESGQMIILATRRGLAPTTVCGDCQNIVVCNNCSAPVVLHKKTENGLTKTFFMCHRCGERRSAEEYCKICGSWKLGSIGIGIDLIIEKIIEKFPDMSIFKIDADSTKIEKSVGLTIQKFKNKPGSILIGTEMMLHYLHDKVENSAIISLDSLFALPDFRIQEKILHMLIRMRALTTKSFMVQTRKSDEKVFEYGLKGNMSDFYKNVIEERKKFNYPPFTTLIKITLEGKKDVIVKEMESVQDILDPFEIEIFPAFTHTVRGNYVLHGLIRVPHDKWPNDDLIGKIKALSPAIIVKVDPDSLL